jgi:adenosylcobyric acid synthase
MHAQGFDRAVHHHSRTGLVVGICGGMQMLGQDLTDPGGVERKGCMPGLGLLPINTTMQAEKVTRLCSGTILGESLFAQPLRDNFVAGYEIHVGKTLYLDHAQPFAKLITDELDGCISADRRVLGTYLHGIFDHDGFRHQFLTAARSFYHLAVPSALNPWSLQREESLNRLAREVATSLDMHRIFAWVGLEYQ